MSPSPSRWLSLMLGLGVVASPPMLGGGERHLVVEDPGHPLVTVTAGRCAPGWSGGAGDAFERAVASGSVRPAALAAADVDGDQVPDLLAAYAGPGGGWLTLHRTRLETRDVRRLDAVRVVELPVAPDLLAAGDLDGDGFADAVVARRGRAALWWLSGNGGDGFDPAREVMLPGVVTAISAHAGLAVAIRTAKGAELIPFHHADGTLRPGPARFSTARDIVDVVAGPCDGPERLDVALAAGRELVLLRGATVERATLPAEIRALAARERTGAGRADHGLALLLADGTLALYETGRDGHGLAPVARTRLPGGGGSPSRLLSLNLSTRVEHDLLLYDPDECGALVRVGGPEAPDWVRIASGAPVAAVLPMRLNGDPLDDLVFLLAGEAEPSTLVTGARSTFTVNSTGDDGDVNLGDGVCATAVGSCTLRAAIEQANATVSTDAITFGIPGTPPHAIRPLSMLPVVLNPVLVDATTQPGYSGSPVVELDGSLAGAADGLVLDAGSSVIGGLAINRFESNAIRIIGPRGSENSIQRNHLGTDVAGAAALPNGGNGVFVHLGATRNVIGTDGDAVADDTEGNLLSGNVQCGVLIVDVGTEGNVVAGNRVGTNAGATAAIANDATGVAVVNGASRNRVGTDGDGVSDLEERNVISGNAVRGVIVAAQGEGGVVAEENVVAGNFIGTDVTGTLAVPNVEGGLELSNGTRRNRVGTDVDGTSDALERNVISGNGAYGITLFGSPTAEDNVIAGNLIGTQVDGVTPLGNSRDGIVVNDDSARNTIGGLGVTPRLCDGPCNRIAFNGTGASLDGVRLAGGIETAIIGNLIYANEGGAAIDLAGAAPTPNDPGDLDGGTNNGQNFPTLTLATTVGDTTTIDGFLDSVPGTDFHLEFFANGTCDASGFGEAETLVGTQEVTTGTDGKATFSVPVTPAVPAGSWLSATATRRDSEGVARETSELSPCLGLGPAVGAGRVPDGLVVPGPQLTVSRLNPMNPSAFVLAWGVSCVPTDVDYAVYVGVLPDFTSHAPRSCSSQGLTTRTVRGIDEPEAYFLVVPLSATREGSYGSDGAGVDRPAAPPGVGCRPQLVEPCP